jgi:hypothetical protein
VQLGTLQHSPQQCLVVVALLLELQLQLLHLGCSLVPLDRQLLQAPFLVCYHTLHASQLLLQASDLLLMLPFGCWLLELILQLLLLVRSQLRQQALLLLLCLLQLCLCCFQLLGKVLGQLLLQGQLLCCNFILEVQLAVELVEISKLLVLWLQGSSAGRTAAPSFSRETLGM